MKKRLFVVLILCFVIGSGCSIIPKKESRSIVGIWTATHDSGASVIIEFKKDLSVVFSVPDYSEYSFKANYSVDYSTSPVSLDFINVNSGGALGNTCLAIVKFSDDNELEFFGTFGSSGQVKRPTKFYTYPELPELYLLLKKNTD